eukprot:3528229-Lingulodinium_polyedra.AAC.1
MIANVRLETGGAAPLPTSQKQECAPATSHVAIVGARCNVGRPLVARRQFPRCNGGNAPPANFHVASVSARFNVGRPQWARK